jgi:type I restriction enzyme M protein
MLEIHDQQKIERALWQSCEVFSGVLEPSETKDYVLALLLLKYVSDRNSDKRLFGFESISALCSQEHVGVMIDKALMKLEKSDRKFEGISIGVSFDATQLGNAEQKKRLLSRLVSELSADVLDFRGEAGATAAAYACDALIRITAERSGKYGGDFFTPTPVTQLMARLTKPKADELVGDPCCGSGSMLIACSEYAHRNYGQGSLLYGQEKNGKTLALAKMNLALHGEMQAQLEWGDTLIEPKLLKGCSLQKFDIAVSNPPFALRDWGHEDASHDPYNRYLRGVPPRASADYAFISHMVATLKEETGRMAVLVSHGVLFRGGTEGEIRKRLIDENIIDAVISLPAKTLSYTAIPVVILVIRKKKKDKSVLFIDASKDFQYGKTQNVLREQDVKRIEEACEERVSEKGYAQLVTHDQIAVNDYNLSVARYIELEEETEEVDLAALQAERAQLRAELAGLESKLTTLLKEVGHA